VQVAKVLGTQRHRAFDPLRFNFFVGWPWWVKQANGDA
jgi:hypothetical protein